MSPRAPLPARQRPVARLPLAPARPGGTAGPLSAVPQFCVSAQGHARGDRRVTFRCASAPPRPATCPWTPRPLRVSAAAGGAALSVGCTSFHIRVFVFSEGAPRSRIAGSGDSSGVNFFEEPPAQIPLSVVAAPAYIPANSARGPLPPSPHPPQSPCLLTLLTAPPTGAQVQGGISLWFRFACP